MCPKSLGLELLYLTKLPGMVLHPAVRWVVQCRNHLLGPLVLLLKVSYSLISVRLPFSCVSPPTLLPGVLACGPVPTFCLPSWVDVGILFEWES